ncbi:MAG: HAMP domain-containing sensor histidine kinase [Flavobacteriales bacterium]
MASEGPHTAPVGDPAQTPNAGLSEQLHAYAHDLKNRVAGLLEVLRQLRTHDPAVEQQDLLDFGERQAFAVLRRNEELLDALGVPRGMPSPPSGWIDLDGVLRSAIANQQYRLDAKQQGLSLNGTVSANVAAEPRQLSTVLEALLSNASKFSPVGAGINVQAHTADGQVIVEVKDEGVGLSASDIDQVFVRYAWLDSRSTAGEPQGRSTLARCKQIAAALGGTLTAQSDGVGKGSLFLLGLPLA